jgi:hypothetical protein
LETVSAGPEQTVKYSGEGGKLTSQLSTQIHSPSPSYTPAVSSAAP